MNPPPAPGGRCCKNGKCAGRAPARASASRTPARFPQPGGSAAGLGHRRRIAGRETVVERVVEIVLETVLRPAFVHPRKLFGRRVLLVRCLPRSEEHTSELQSLMRISYDVFCLKKKTN